MKDFRCNQGVPSCAGKIGGIIKQPVTEYTYAMFQVFQRELWESLLVQLRKLVRMKAFICISLLKMVIKKKKKMHREVSIL